MFSVLPVPASSKVPKAPSEPTVELLFSTNDYSVYSLRATARCWKKLTDNKWMVIINLPRPKKEAANAKVAIALENGGKVLPLPCKYYQNHKCISIRGYHCREQIKITLTGNFIINVNVPFRFKLLYIPKGSAYLFKRVNLKNAGIIKKLLVPEIG